MIYRVRHNTTTWILIVQSDIFLQCFHRDFHELPILIHHRILIVQSDIFLQCLFCLIFMSYRYWYINGFLSVSRYWYINVLRINYAFNTPGWESIAYMLLLYINIFKIVNELKKFWKQSNDFDITVVYKFNVFRKNND